MAEAHPPQQTAARPARLNCLRGACSLFFTLMPQYYNWWTSRDRHRPKRPTRFLDSDDEVYSDQDATPRAGGMGYSTVAVGVTADRPS